MQLRSPTPLAALLLPGMFCSLPLPVPSAEANCGPLALPCLIGKLGDLDLDGDVDDLDRDQLLPCITGPVVAIAGNCTAFELSGDTSIDLSDIALLQNASTGSCNCPADISPPAARIFAPTFVGVAPLTVQLDGSASTDAEAIIRTHAWDFGDGSSSSGAQTTHTFTQPGEFVIVLQVEDGSGKLGSTDLTVTVSDGTFSLNDPISENDARRFLTQASFGPTDADIAYVMANGYEAWIDLQMAIPVTEMRYVVLQNQERRTNEGTNPAGLWDDFAVEAPDQLRQRMAWALIQILTMNRDQNQIDDEGNAFYYNQYLLNAFGNYRDLLGYITRSMHMGIYLTYFDNEKADPVLGTSPDENYARELPQLYAIGLWELGIDGSRLQSLAGEDIPTFDNNDIKQFARIFTGYSWNYLAPDDESLALHPMLMYPYRHEYGDKQLFNYANAVPAGGYIPARPGAEHSRPNAEQDVDDALDNVFYHPNLAPFIAKQMIQRFVTSNPSNSYVARAALAFEGYPPYGSGMRGDLGALIKSILLDEEARNPAYRDNPRFGLVREPLIARWGLYRILQKIDRTNLAFPHRIAANPWNTSDIYGQGFMESPSVFNFYPPDYTPPATELSVGNYVAPELKIIDDVTVLATANDMLYEQIVDFGGTIAPKLSLYQAFADDPVALVDLLNDELTFGSLTDEARDVIVDAISLVIDDAERVRAAVWLIVNSDEYRVLR